MTGARTFLLALLLLLLAAAARAQHTASAPVIEGVNAEPHAWVVLPRRLKNSERWALVHLPPRSLPPRAAVLPAPDGVVKMAALFDRQPEAIAAVSRRVYVIFPPQPDGVSRLVMSLAATPSPLGDVWVFPTEGRLETMPGLPVTGSIIAAAGAPEGPAVLVSSGDDNPPQLLILGRAGWQRTDLPPGVLDPLALGVIGSRLAVVSRDPAGYALHTRADDTWQSRPLPALTSESPDLRIVDRRLLNITQSNGARTLFDVTGDHPLELLALTRDITALGVIDPAPGGSVGRVFALWGTEPRAKYHIAEFSALTGRRFFEGPTKDASPISVLELRLFAIFLVSAVAAVLFIALRPEPAIGPLSLPAGTAPAPWWLRAAAGLLDFFAALLPAALLGVGWSDLGLPGVGHGALWSWAIVLGLGFLHATIAECLWGRSLGKVLLGCRIVPALGQGRIPVSRLILRSFIRWMLWPMALVGLCSRSRRHAGDVLAGAVVVLQIEEQPT